MSRTVQKVKYIERKLLYMGKFSGLQIQYHTKKMVKTGKHPVWGHRVLKEESFFYLVYD